MTEQLGECISCGAMVPDGDVYPWLGHSPICSLVVEWRKDHGENLREEVQKLRTENKRLRAHETCELGSDCPCYRKGYEYDDRSDLYD